jgi:hypothetical protein
VLVRTGYVARWLERAADAAVAAYLGDPGAGETLAGRPQHDARAELRKGTGSQDVPGGCGLAGPRSLNS